MLLVFILTISVFFQLSAALYALWLIRLTGYKLAWILISSALLLMSVRRIIPLYYILADMNYSYSLLNEIIGLVLSVLMMIGIYGIRTIFKESKLFEKELVYLNKKNKLILDSVAEGILGLDLNGNHTFVNPAAARMLGYEVDELIGRPSHELWHHTKPDGSYYPQEECGIYSVYREGKISFSTKEVFWRKNRTFFPVEYLSTPIFEGNRITGAVVTFLNITERKLEETLQISKARLLSFAISHNLDELMEETLNEVEKLTFSSIGFYHFVNSDQESLTLQNWSTRTKKEYCRAEGKGTHYNISEAGVWVECIYKKSPVIHNDYASLKNKKGLPPGHAVVLRELVVPVIRADKIVAILGVGNKQDDYDEVDMEIVNRFADLVWDVFEHKHAELEIQKKNIELSAQNEKFEVMNEELKSANRELILIEEDLKKSLQVKETLIRELYHRTKNTMQIICGMLELQAADHSENAELNDFVKDIENRINAMSLVHHMLYSSLDLSRISIRNYIDDLSVLLLASHGKTSEKILFQFDIDDIFFLLDTAIPFGLILNELISNSLKYAFPDNKNGLITIILKKSETGKNILRYSDDGVGVPDGFDFRNSNTLGFKLIYSIGEIQMMGDLKIESKNGIICLFEFCDNLYQARV